MSHWYLMFDSFNESIFDKFNKIVAESSYFVCYSWTISNYSNTYCKQNLSIYPKQRRKSNSNCVLLLFFMFC